MRRLRLAAYGNSLYLKGIAACLAGHTALTVVPVEPGAPDARQRLEELAPDAIMFELGNPSLARPMELLHERPDLLLIALDPGCEEIIVLSGQRAQPTTAGELVDVLLANLPQPV